MPRGRPSRGGQASSTSGPASAAAAAGAAAAATGPGAPAAPTAGGNSNTALIVPDDDRPQFGPISLRELEFAQRRNADGAESSVWSDDDDDDGCGGGGPAQRKRKHRKKARGSGSSGEGRPALDANDEDAMAAAAFGGYGDGGDAVDDDDDDGEEECEGEDNDEKSVANESSVTDGARLLPIRGETCVGCICDRSVIDTVDRFVRANAVCMTEKALYKAAALHYKNEVMIPRKREGVRVLPWKWKDLQAHYVLHTCDPLLQRAAAVRSLGAVRAVQEQNLMRHNADGSKVLDHKGAELLLKIVALQVCMHPTSNSTPSQRSHSIGSRPWQDKQLLALDAARMPPPPARGGGR